ncbi:retrotransposon protein, putative, ty1-copia subclass [Tanacetum coccineum]|uniref:Retrotransposon protein, putative, ty1-copia subclass n=1 Tax=Tanacetum coccineum TaxID=301880 RepID=A0ABQ5F7Z4_9ASTR
MYPKILDRSFSMDFRGSKIDKIRLMNRTQLLSGFAGNTWFRCRDSIRKMEQEVFFVMVIRRLEWPGSGRRVGGDSLSCVWGLVVSEREPATEQRKNKHFYINVLTILKMAAAAQNINNSTLRKILLSEKLTGPNFTNRHRNLRIALRFENKLVHLEQALIPIPLPAASQAARDAYEALFDAQNDTYSFTWYMGKTIVELHVMLKLHDKGISKKAKTPVVLAIKEGKIQKDKKKPQGAKGKYKGKTKLAYAPKPKIPPSPKRENPEKDFVFHHCKEVGHWRRNYPSYHAELEKRKNANRASTLAVEAIGSFDLVLPSGLIIVLDNCHFAPTITRGVVSVSRLVDNGYIHTFTNYGISVSKDNVFYFNAIPCYGIYEIDMHDHYPNVSSIYNVSNKRAKHALDSTHQWHCRLGHINKKRMEKKPTHDESLEKCKFCISRKMARTPFPHQVERAKDLLGLIHTDSFWGYALESAARILNMVPTKKVDRTSYEIWHVPIRRSGRISQALDRYSFYVDAEEHELGDLNEPPNYKAALSYPKSEKWLDAIEYVEFKKTDMDGNVRTFKAHLVAKGYTHTYDVDYEETFSPIADIRAIRIVEN